MSKRGGRREGSGRKKLDVCKSKRIRISEDLFQRWKDLKRIRKARSDEELVAYLLDLAIATNLSDSPRYGKRRTTVTSLSFISLHSFRHHVAFSTKFCEQTPRSRTFFLHTHTLLRKLHSRQAHCGFSTGCKLLRVQLPWNSTFKLDTFARRPLPTPHTSR